MADEEAKPGTNFGKALLSGGARALAGAIGALAGGGGGIGSDPSKSSFDVNQSIGYQKPLLDTTQSMLGRETPIREPFIRDETFDARKIDRSDPLRSIDIIHHDIANWMTTINKNVGSVFTYVRDIKRDSDGKFKEIRSTFGELAKRDKELEGRIEKLRKDMGNRKEGVLAGDLNKSDTQDARPSSSLLETLGGQIGAGALGAFATRFLKGGIAAGTAIMVYEGLQQMDKTKLRNLIRDMLGFQMSPEEREKPSWGKGSSAEDIDRKFMQDHPWLAPLVPEYWADKGYIRGPRDSTPKTNMGPIAPPQSGIQVFGGGNQSFGGSRDAIPKTNMGPLPPPQSGGKGPGMIGPGLVSGAMRMMGFGKGEPTQDTNYTPQGSLGNYYGPGYVAAYQSISPIDLLASMRAITAGQGMFGGGGASFGGTGGNVQGAGPRQYGGNIGPGRVGSNATQPAGPAYVPTSKNPYTLDDIQRAVTGKGNRGYNPPGGRPGQGGYQGFAESRKQFKEAMDRDPALKQRVFNMMNNEQGTDPRGTQGVLESLLNRTENYMARNPGMSAAQALAYNAKYTSEGGYYEHGGAYVPDRVDMKNPVYQRSADAVFSGSDITRGATDNYAAWAHAQSPTHQQHFEEREVIGAGGGESFEVGKAQGYGQPRAQWEQWYKNRTEKPQLEDQSDYPKEDTGAVVTKNPTGTTGDKSGKPQSEQETKTERTYNIPTIPWGGFGMAANKMKEAGVPDDIVEKIRAGGQLTEDDVKRFTPEQIKGANEALAGYGMKPLVEERQIKIDRVPEKPQGQQEQRPQTEIKHAPDDQAQMRRPEWAGGTFTYGGKEYRWGSGGARNDYGYKATMPYGDVPITGPAMGPIGQRMGALEINKNQIWDPQHNRMTGGIELHPDGMSDKLLTQGCIGIAGNQWRELKAQILADMKAGKSVYIHFHEQDGKPVLTMDNTATGGETQVRNEQDLQKVIPQTEMQTPNFKAALREYDREQARQGKDVNQKVSDTLNQKETAGQAQRFRPIEQKPQTVEQKKQPEHASPNVTNEAGPHKIASGTWPPSAPMGHGGPREVHTHDANTAVRLARRPDAGPTGGIGLLHPPHPEAPMAHGQLREQHTDAGTLRHDLVQRRHRAIQDRVALHGLENVNKETGLPHFTAQSGGQLPKSQVRDTRGTQSSPPQNNYPGNTPNDQVGPTTHDADSDGPGAGDRGIGSSVPDADSWDYVVSKS